MSSNEFREIAESLNQLRKENMNCDVVIKIGDVTYPAHRLILISRMEFFKNMFNAEMKEKKEPVVTLEPTIVSSNVFEDILNYIYTSELKFTEENAAPIYVAANFFYDEKLMKKAESFMETNLKVTNVSEFLQIAMRIGLNSLEEKCKNFIVENSLSEIVKRDLIPWLSFEDLKMVLEEFKKKSKQEEMFHFAIEWVELDEDQRDSKLPELLENIPLSSLSFKFLKEVVCEQRILLKSLKCFHIFVEAFKRIKIHESSKNLIYVFGGKDGTIFPSVSKFDSSTGKWSESTPLSEKRTHFDCAVVEDKIYLCGGYDGNKSLNTLEVFDSKTETFQTLSPMKHARQSCGVAALNGFIYVAGGWDGTNRFDAVEKYSIEANQWHEVPPMQTKQSGLKLVELNGKLYALGGYDGNDGLNTVECYDPEEDRWKFKTSMNNKYYWFGAVSFENKIYVVGKKTSEVYHSLENRWEEIPHPNECENGRSLVVFKGKLVVIGGRIGEAKEWKGIPTVQYYDFVNRVWKTGKNMNVPRCYHASAVISPKCLCSQPFNL